MTLNYYEANAPMLIERYDSADMSVLHALLSRHILKNSKVIDIGFGSGRDLSYLHTQGHEIYGIDPTEEFVARARKEFSDTADHFIQGTFSSRIPHEWLETFDVVMSIAVWMHLKSDEHERAANMIRLLLKKGGIVVLSFSLGARAGEDSRHFEPLTLDGVLNEFLQAGFTLMDSQCSEDSLGRDSIQWVTVVFKND